MPGLGCCICRQYSAQGSLGGGQCRVTFHLCKARPAAPGHGLYSAAGLYPRAAPCHHTLLYLHGGSGAGQLVRCLWLMLFPGTVVSARPACRPAPLLEHPIKNPPSSGLSSRRLSSKAYRRRMRGGRLRTTPVNTTPGCSDSTSTSLLGPRRLASSLLKFICNHTGAMYQVV
jgi:hypothetical protein